MEIGMSSIYLEVGIRFGISYKVSKLIRKLLLEDIVSIYNLKEEKLLELRETTSKLQKKVEIELKIDKDSMVYYIKLPYEEIAKHEDQREAFLKYYFDGLVMVFKEFGVWEEHIREVEKKVKEEVLNNDEYKYVDKTIRIDPSKFDF